MATIKQSKPGTSMPGLLDIAAAAAYLSISERMFYKVISREDCPIKARRVGSLVRYRVSELDEYIDSLPVGAGKHNARREA